MMHHTNRKISWIKLDHKIRVPWCLFLRLIMHKHLVCSYTILVWYVLYILIKVDVRSFFFCDVFIFWWLSGKCKTVSTGSCFIPIWILWSQDYDLKIFVMFSIHLCFTYSFSRFYGIHMFMFQFGSYFLHQGDSFWSFIFFFFVLLGKSIFYFDRW